MASSTRRSASPTTAGFRTSLASRRLSRAEVVAAFAPGHAPRAASIAIGDLVSAPVIALRRGSAITSAVERQATAAGHELHLSLESGDPVLLRALAARDFATAILPRSISSLDGPPIEIRSLRPALMLSVLLAWRRHHDITPAARAFVRFVLAEIAPQTTVARP